MTARDRFRRLWHHYRAAGGLQRKSQVPYMPAFAVVAECLAPTWQREYHSCVNWVEYIRKIARVGRRSGRDKSARRYLAEARTAREAEPRWRLP